MKAYSENANNVSADHGREGGFLYNIYRSLVFAWKEYGPQRKIERQSLGYIAKGFDMEMTQRELEKAQERADGPV